ncbi:IS5 family transposase [Massilia atriviolacea]|uniref:IS5 family transposase n=1 Tax=Massilia atriviolacea TaxID=2495579 RepID=A0A430HG71_9BURK|nr:IS5 family transposase [Massilia atriviolacea]RSZ56554.1 IS5 family transposase [Massilia atriviolacea]
MWTAEQRARHSLSASKGRSGYRSDISDQEWKLVEPLLPGRSRTGSPRKTELRQVINALRYLVRSGCEWRMLPNDFPPYQTVYYWFRRLMRRFLFRTIHDLALMLDRMCEQREVVPSAGIVDSQSVRAPGARERGYDAHKKIGGRKRHIAVDTDGRLLAMHLTPADIADSTGAQFVLDALVKRWPWVQHLFGDAAYDRRTLLDKAAYLDFTLDVVRGLQGQICFKVQPRRWVVERTFAWLMRYRRLVRDYEQRLDVSEAMMYIALGSSLLHRIRFR